MTTDMTTRQNGAIAPYVQPEIEEGDFGIPDQELRAPFLPFNGKLGQFTDTITGEVLGAVKLVLLRRLPASRIKWNKDPEAPKDQAIQCRSLDMVYPVDQEQARALGAGPTCAECPFSQFEKDKSGKMVKSACSEYLNLAVAFADDDEPLPYVLGVKSTGIKPIRQLLQQLSWLRVAKKAKKIPGYALVFQLEPGPLAGEGVRKYFPISGRVLSEMVPEERWPGLSALWRVVSQATIDTTAEATAEALDEDADPAAQDDDPGVPIETGDELIARMDAEARAEQERQVEPQSATQDWLAADVALGEPDPPVATLFDTAPPRTDPVDSRRGHAGPKAATRS